MMPNPMMMGNMGNMVKMVQQFKANPTQFILQRGFNLPAYVGTDPNAILQHLVTSGQVSQQQINNAYQMAQRFR